MFPPVAGFCLKSMILLKVPYLASFSSIFHEIFCEAPQHIQVGDGHTKIGVLINPLNTGLKSNSYVPGGGAIPPAGFQAIIITQNEGQDKFLCAHPLPICVGGSHRKFREKSMKNQRDMAFLVKSLIFCKIQPLGEIEVKCPFSQ